MSPGCRLPSQQCLAQACALPAAHMSLTTATHQPKGNREEVAWIGHTQGPQTLDDARYNMHEKISARSRPDPLHGHMAALLAGQPSFRVLDMYRAQMQQSMGKPHKSGENSCGKACSSSTTTTHVWQQQLTPQARCYPNASPRRQLLRTGCCATIRKVSKLASHSGKLILQHLMQSSSKFDQRRCTIQPLQTIQQRLQGHALPEAPGGLRA
jgi:hypothetical protein